jgi:alanine racemase
VQPPHHRPAWVEVDLDAIRSNAAALRRHARAGLLMAVVKADAYGHGAVPVAGAALEGGADWLGVALVEEGEQLRAAGVDAPVLLLSEPPPAAAPAVLAAGLTPTVYTHAFATALAAAAGPGRVVDVHLKLDTGMRRVGLPEQGWDEAFRRLAATDRLRVTGLWSHLAVGDEPDNPFSAEQGRRFADGVRRARAAGLRPELLHLANSGATTLFPDLHLDVVRTGIALYGLEAAPGVALDALRPALSLRARLSMVKAVAAGETVSYGRRWAAPRDTVVGTVPIGYADGVRRSLTNTGEVWVAGRRAPVVGTVTMDQLMVDLGPDAVEGIGEDVWLLGGPGPDSVTAADWARWLDTITYEVTCGLGPRLPRRHLGG